MSPSQREDFMNAELREYQKPEIIRQAIKLVKQSAAETAAKRERATSEIKSPSKIKQNLKTQKKARAQSALFQARKAEGRQSFAPEANYTTV